MKVGRAENSAVLGTDALAHHAGRAAVEGYAPAAGSHHLHGTQQRVRAQQRSCMPSLLLD